MPAPRRRSLGVLATALLVGAPAGCTLLPWYRVPDDTFARDTVRVACCSRGGGEVEVTYLGVGGWIFRTPEGAVLAAPLYSNPGMLRTGLARIAAEPEVIDRELPDVSDVSAILVGHGHYDHLMDVPWIMEHRARDALLYANRTSWLQVEPFGFERRELETVGDELRPREVSEGREAAGRVVVLDDSLAGTDAVEGRWIRVSPGARIMPLLADHSPHLAGVTLYSGERHRPMDAPPASANEWLDGRTYAFLIDLLAPDGTRRMRIYYQDAVAAAPFGLVPPVAGDSVDLAIVVPATYAEVDWQPEALLEDARPAHVLLGHWENFFQPPDAEPEPVQFTFLSDFLRRLRRALPPGVGYHVPVPGTVFLFR